MTIRQQVSQATRDTFRDRQEEGMAQCLGWFSVGLGAAELVAPQQVAKVIGVKADGDLLPAMGLRELATGVGLLSTRRPAEWMWGRVAGDIMDLAYLGNAMLSPRNDKFRLAAAALTVAGVTAIDLFCAQQLSARPARDQAEEVDEPGIAARATISINASADQLYRFWRDFENLPRLMTHLTSVTRIDDRRSHWVAEGPAGATVEWDADLIDDVPNERISWQSTENSALPNSGTVRFFSAGPRHGTTVSVDLRYEAPGGTLGAVLAFLFGKEPRQQITEDLRAYKAFVETGEVPTTQGQASGRGRD